MIVELYRWEGRWMGLKIPTSCKECDVLTAYVKGLKKKYPEIKFVIKPWFNEWPKLLFKYGAWHAPILIVNEKIFSQGKIPNLKKLENYLVSFKN